MRHDGQLFVPVEEVREDLGLPWAEPLRTTSMQIPLGQAVDILILRRDLVLGQVVRVVLVHLPAISVEEDRDLDGLVEGPAGGLGVQDVEVLGVALLDNLLPLLDNLLPLLGVLHLLLVLFLGDQAKL